MEERFDNYDTNYLDSGNEYLDYDEDIQTDTEIDVEEPYRINNGSRALMLGVALFFDISQIIVILSFAITSGGVLGFIGGLLSSMITGIAWFIFFVWFKIKRVSLFERRFGKWVAGLIIEAIPFVNSVIPSLTILVFLTITETRLDDKHKLLKYLERFEDLL